MRYETMGCDSMEMGIGMHVIPESMGGGAPVLYSVDESQEDDHHGREQGTKDGGNHAAGEEGT